MTLNDAMIDALIKEGYSTLTAIELASDKMKEVATFPKGKHKIYVGKTEISFRKE